MRNLKKIITLLCAAFVLTACFEDLDDDAVASQSINDFVWKAMNYFYLYKDNIPDLANDRFSSDAEYTNFLGTFATPELLFESLIYDRENIDRFSIITSDYIALEQLFDGVTRSTGLEFDFYFEPGSSTQIFGIVRLVLNNSPAANQGLQRGQIFNAVDGVALTNDNAGTLLNQDSYTLNFANYNDNGTPTLADDTIESTTESETITKVEYSENPVHRTEIIEVNSQNVGYLMYNGFTSDFNSQLNNVFADFLANNVQHVILDLRYNPGGSVNTSTLLGSMITGQFNGEVYTELLYNNDLQSNNTTFNFTNTFSGNAINSLNLQKVYVLTSNTSASASEMVINSLNSYIEVIQIGDNTRGKSQASITVYDSPDFGRSGANPNHNYALQPLVAKTVNKFNEEVPANGLVPTIALNENPINYGVLGNENEPLLAAAIQHIIDNGRIAQPNQHPFKTIKTNVDYHPLQYDMHID